MAAKNRLAAFALVCAVGATVATTDADARPGFRVGLTDDPDALTLGFQYGIFVSRASSGFFVFEPGIDFGVVEGPIDFLIRGTFHFKYVLPLGRQVAFYPLLGPAVAYTSADDADNTDVGLDLGLGFAWNAFSVEFWAGFNDLPDLTLAFAFRF